MAGWTPEQLITKFRSIRIPQDETSLEGLEAIRWSELRHAHGAAGDVPALLRASLSDNEDEREFAFELLHETIWHQGSVYEASAYVVPFLYKMLQSPQTPDKDSVAFLLASLADGSHYLQYLASRSKKDEEEWHEILSKQGSNLETEIAREANAVNTTREAVGQGLRILYPYLEHAESGVRWSIAKMLAVYPDRANETLPLLKNALAHENAKYAREAMEASIAKLTNESNDYPNPKMTHDFSS